MTIWMIQVRGYDEDAGYDYVRTRSEYGYFTDKAQAQLKADQLNAPVIAEWEQALVGIAEENTAAEQRFREELAEVMERRKTSIFKITDPKRRGQKLGPKFADWVRDEGSPTYSPEPVEEGTV